MRSFAQNKRIELADIPVGDAQGVIQAEADALEALVVANVRNIMKEDFYISLETCIHHCGSETEVELLTTANIATELLEDNPEGWERITYATKTP